MSLKDGKAGLFVSVFNMDDNRQKEDIARLSQLTGIEAVFTAHHGYTTDFDAAFADWRR